MIGQSRWGALVAALGVNLMSLPPFFLRYHRYRRRERLLGGHLTAGERRARGFLTAAPSRGKKFFLKNAYKIYDANDKK